MNDLELYKKMNDLKKNQTIIIEGNKYKIVSNNVEEIDENNDWIINIKVKNDENKVSNLEVIFNEERDIILVGIFLKSRQITPKEISFT